MFKLKRLGPVTPSSTPLFDYTAMNSPSKFSATSSSVAHASVLSSQPLPANRLPVAQNGSCDARLPQAIYLGDVIVIDGNQGGDLIDLSSYDVENALFQGDTIEINRGTENHFVIEYKNVVKAVFAGNINVDL